MQILDFYTCVIILGVVRVIVAIDKKRGMADNHGIPWAGKIPSDVKYFREKTEDGTVLMGYATYLEFGQPLPNRRNFVATSRNQKLNDGFEPVNDAVAFLQDYKNNGPDIWVIGGAGLFTSTINLVDELYLTLLDGDFSCTKLFPEYDKDFELVSQTEPYTENGVTFRFTIWKRLQKQG